MTNLRQDWLCCERKKHSDARQSAFSEWGITFFGQEWSFFDWNKHSVARQSAFFKWGITNPGQERSFSNWSKHSVARQSALSERGITNLGQERLCIYRRITNLGAKWSCHDNKKRILYPAYPISRQSCAIDGVVRIHLRRNRHLGRLGRQIR